MMHAGSGSSWDGSFWEPICQPNYVALGHVSVRNHGAPPGNAAMCVKSDYANVAKWVYVWNDSGTGSDRDCTVFRADALNSAGQGLQAMGAVAHHGDMDRTAYVLKSDVIQYIQGKPATSYIMQNVNYLFNDKNTLSNSVEQLARTIVENHGTSSQSAVREISYTYEETHDWSVEIGLERSIEVSVTAGIPDIGSASVSPMHAIYKFVSFVIINFIIMILYIGNSLYHLQCQAYNRRELYTITHGQHSSYNRCTSQFTSDGHSSIQSLCC